MCPSAKPLPTLCAKLTIVEADACRQGFVCVCGGGCPSVLHDPRRFLALEGLDVSPGPSAQALAVKLLSQPPPPILMPEIRCVQCWHSYGKVDVSVVQSAANAWAAGMERVGASYCSEPH